MCCNQGNSSNGSCGNHPLYLSFPLDFNDNNAGLAELLSTLSVARFATENDEAENDSFGNCCRSRCRRWSCCGRG